MEPQFNDLRYNDILGITIHIRLPVKSYSKMYGAEPRYNDLRYDYIPGLTMGLSLTERKIFPVITITSISQTTEMLKQYNKLNFYYINHNSKLFLTNFIDIKQYSGWCICNLFDNQLQIY